MRIISFGHAELRKKCENLDPDFLDWNALIEDMWTTLDATGGCGLSASQINLPVKLFIVNSKTVFDSYSEKERGYYFENDQGIQETFINARITERSFEKWIEYEGCLSIPAITERIERSWNITIDYLDRNFIRHVESFSGMTGRIIQHEYDHTEGILYLDHLKPVKRKLLENKLSKISSGSVPPIYPMKFPENPL